MAYDLYDFKESITIAGIDKDDIKRCTLGFGHSPEGYGSWEGGFVCLLNDNTWVFVFGWCDTTGWGCQDGAYTTKFDHEPNHHELGEAWIGQMWDEIMLDQADVDPVDINRYLQGLTD